MQAPNNRTSARKNRIMINAPCDGLIGRKLEICRGEGIDPEKRIRYLKRWGLLTDDNAKSTPPDHAAKAKTVPDSRPPRPKREKPQRATLPPCVHLGDVVREEGCRLCGGRRAIAAVHACSLHGECTQSNYGLKVPGRYMATCIRCIDYSEIGGLATVPK